MKLIDVVVIKPVRDHENRAASIFRTVAGFDIEWCAQEGLVRIKKQGFTFDVVIPVTNVADWRESHAPPPLPIAKGKSKTASAA